MEVFNIRSRSKTIPSLRDDQGEDSCYTLHMGLLGSLWTLELESSYVGEDTQIRYFDSLESAREAFNLTYAASDWP